ncbi:glycosyltransferase family 1 protein [Polaribacter sp. WD7]|uniref:glycosyltransferase family 4 protein n=1 Tax=Polaribacter sp. WD7 TaxID=2269061 RepID=UPI000DF18CB0|nr:glycosyltransferase family 4 protein [Polaribacter sp. WD7]RCS28149.1 glycosyltransferase family 1 protein [Polaribacter sp. WD7]
MRVGMILDEEFPPDPRVENEALSLIEAGHEVFLFCLNYTKKFENKLINEIQVKSYPSTKLTYKLSALAYTLPFYKVLLASKITHFISENNIEILHIHDIRIAGTVFFVNQKFNLKTVLDLHENRPEIMKYYPHLLKFPGKYLISPKKWKKKEESFLIKSDKIIVVTKESKEEILSRVNIGNTKIVIVPNTVRINFYKDAKVNDEIFASYKEKFVLLYIGDTGLRRGLQTAIKAIKVLKDSIKNIQLVIVGKNSSDSVLRNLTNDLELKEYIDFVGWKNPDLFKDYILSSDICISPLHRNLHHDTTYANKIFQYLSLGKPVLVSNATAQKNIVEKYNTGLVHEDRNVKGFVDKTLLLYNDKSLREKLGANGKHFIENEFSWEHTSKKLLHLYDNLSS